MAKLSTEAFIISDHLNVLFCTCACFHPPLSLSELTLVVLGLFTDLFPPQYSLQLLKCLLKPSLVVPTTSKSASSSVIALSSLLPYQLHYALGRKKYAWLEFMWFLERVLSFVFCL